MRFSTLTLLTLPFLAVATQEQSPLDQAKATGQAWLNKLYGYIPNPNVQHTPEAAAAKAGGRTLNILTINDWKETIESSIKPGSTTPEEWWILVTGHNKTCWAGCERVETAFNETAALWSLDPTAPHLAYLNCDKQPVLCNSWAAGPPTLWIMEVAPKPAKSDLRIFAMNATTTTVKSFTNLHSTKSWRSKNLYEGHFHPLDGTLAQYGLSTFAGYFFWAFTIVPNWLMMIIISLVSRNMMGNRLNPGAPAGRR